MNWPLQENAIDEVDINLLAEFVKTTKRFTQGEKVLEFEETYSKWLGTKYSVFVNSGSSANLLLIASLKELYRWGPEAEIIVPTVTWSTNVAPIIQLGLKPVFVDINLYDLSFNHYKMVLAITPNTKAIFVTHLLGIPAGIPEGMMVIEDCCEAHGATIDGIKVGNFGIGSTFSFYWGHHITSIEGGMVCTDDEELYKLLLLKRSHGLARELPEQYHAEIKERYPDANFSFLFLTDGFNLRNSEFNAVVGLQQLRKIDEFIDKRNENYKYFLGICKPYGDHLLLLDSEGISSFCLPFIFRKKEMLKDFLKVLEENEIESRSPIVGGNLTKHPFLAQYSGDFPNADFVHTNSCYIGNNQFVDYDRLDRLKEILRKFFK